MKKLVIVSMLVLFTIAPLCWGQCEEFTGRPMPEPANISILTLEQDRALGRNNLVHELKNLSEKQGRPVRSIKDTLLIEYLDGLFAKLIAVAPASAKQFSHTIEVLDYASPNAIQFGGGVTAITMGQLALSPSEDMLVFVLAHEMAHAALRHAAAQWSFLNALQWRELSQDEKAKLARLEREHEIEADIFGARVAIAAGYNPKSAARGTLEREWRHKLLKCEMQGHALPKETLSRDFFKARNHAKMLLAVAQHSSEN